MVKKTRIVKEASEVKIEYKPKPEVREEEYHYVPEVKKRISFIDWVIDLLKDERGSTSIKPLIALVGGFILCFALVYTFFMEKQIIPSDTLINAVVFITIAAMGGDSIDKFSYKKTTTDTTVSNSPPSKPPPGPRSDEPPLN